MPDCLSGTVPHMSNEITTRDRIPTQSTGGNEDLPQNYAEILAEVKNEVRAGVAAIEATYSDQIGLSRTKHSAESG